MTNVIRCILLLALAFPSTGFCGNPFDSIPTGIEVPDPIPGPEKPDPERPPLLRWPLEQYVIMGILLSAKNSLAIVRTPAPHSQSYLMRFGDPLGDKDGVIRKIDGSGLTILQTTLNLPKEMRLDVRNKGVKKKDD